MLRGLWRRATYKNTVDSENDYVCNERAEPSNAASRGSLFPGRSNEVLHQRYKEIDISPELTSSINGAALLQWDNRCEFSHYPMQN